MRTYKKLIVGTVLSALVLTACDSSEEPTAQGTDTGERTELRVAYSAQPPILDPHEQLAIAVSDVMRHVMEPLVTIDSEYNVKPMLAESFEQSEDGTEIQFVLREDVVFHNGKPMTAEDVEASMNKWLGAAGSRNQFHEDAHVEIDGDYEVTLHLQQPLATALPLMAFTSTGFPGIMPKEIVEEANEQGVNDYIGTGPYQFEEWVTDQHIHLSKYEDYVSSDVPTDGLAGEKSSNVDDIYFEFVLDPTTRISGVQTGQYDIAHSVPFDSAEQMDADPNLENLYYPGGFLNVHFNKREGFFVDQEARQSLVKSMNNEAILTGAYSNDNFYDLNHNIMMYHQLNNWDSDEGLDVYEQQDPSVMEGYLDAIDYAGEPITIITTRDYEDQYNGAVVLQEQMQQLGMNVELEVYDWPTLLEVNQDESAYDIYVMGNVSVPEPSSNYYFDPNYPGWTTLPDELFELRNAASVEDGIDAYDDLLAWYWEEVPVYKVGDYTRFLSYSTDVEGLDYLEGFVLWNIQKEN
ncbi:ABC transporter substrate-binding protein [Geomicrobium sp. JCM 19038]|uniref:ABC transporter substrate-binding protein n=1 Tax=Geomicrobium sp. JCM 19038 TaxID=1460635 RepID=UPI00045F1574|nr:ABC transporter substrate-binding protein [Geomicrobium sp. JCM 19038]GAK08462.1 dipeptide-binding ABC transporter, periplasmic substrate-binding component [Geomicrobium sp. JCM 19038]